MTKEITGTQLALLRRRYEAGDLVAEAAAAAGMSATAARVHLRRMDVQLRDDRGRYERKRAEIS